MNKDRTQVWSCGGGTQSGAIAALIALGKLPKPDIAFMINVGRERSSTWPFVEQFIRPQLALAGVELAIVDSQEYADIDLFWSEESNAIMLPGFTTMNGGNSKMRPFCSGKWKRDVSSRYLRARGVESARVWIGISLDEAQRVRSQSKLWLELWYPLIREVPMRRYQCVEVIRSQGWDGHIPHSACFMCPNHRDDEWIEMKLHWPADFQAACDIETEIRERDKTFYLHQSCIPLADVDFLAQTTMFTERGCTEGCFT